MEASEIYAGVDLATAEQTAIKLERCDSKKQVLKLEVAVLKKLQGCAHICRFIHCGRSGEHYFCVMELLGENLSELRRRRPSQKFSIPTCARLGSQMLRAIQSCHRRGFLHRDIKPSNYAIGLTTDKQRTVYIIDFGLARRFRTPTGDIRAPRDTAGFRGTARYASINSHQAKELARRDDLWSLFYVMVEFMVGYLPWRRLKEKDEILKLKLKYTNQDLVKGLPTEMSQFLTMLNSMGYETEPDYDMLDQLMANMLRSTGFDESAPYDWQLPDTVSGPDSPSYEPQDGMGSPVGGPRRISYGTSLQPRPPIDLPTNRPLGRYGSQTAVQRTRAQSLTSPRLDDLGAISHLSPGLRLDDAMPSPRDISQVSHNSSQKFRGGMSPQGSLHAGAEITNAEGADNDGDDLSGVGSPNVLTPSPSRGGIMSVGSPISRSPPVSRKPSLVGVLTGIVPQGGSTSRRGSRDEPVSVLGQATPRAQSGRRRSEAGALVQQRNKKDGSGCATCTLL